MVALRPCGQRSDLHTTALNSTPEQYTPSGTCCYCRILCSAEVCSVCLWFFDSKLLYVLHISCFRAFSCGCTTCLCRFDFISRWRWIWRISLKHRA
ncbi:hypothetical protein PGIGA_G00248580 [Pangasianodon gigas]|uniref:Uncharacterized protein n=1 Tax=Pangasianodon gigas TaxID=30993 RepID=A0ACC5WQ63_PANGG|nr:hypothetical protein [Pangasianodon gigas]